MSAQSENAILSSKSCFAGATVFFVFALCVTFAGATMRGIRGNGYDLFSRYCLLWLAPLAPGVAAWSGRKMGLSDIALSAAFPLWFLLCCLYHGIPLTTMGKTQSDLAHLAAVALIAFPFASATDDARERKILDAALLTFFVVFATMLLIAFYGVFRGNCLSFWRGRVRFGATYSATGRLIFNVLLWHQYSTAFLSVICALLVPYLAAAHPHRSFYILAILLELIFLAAIALCASRNAMLALTLGVACMLAIGMKRASLSAGAQRLCFFIAFALLLMLGAYAMHIIYRHVTHSIRTVWYGITTLTSRTEIWSAVPLVLRERPQALLWGLPYDNLMPILNEYIPLKDPITHMHSGYIHTLCGMGAPGLILALAYTFSFFRDFFVLLRAKAEDGITTADQLLAVAPFACWCIDLLEPELFLPGSAMLFLNLFFALTRGYLRCAARSAGE